MICIAIDGPAGSGKSSVSKLVAKNLGFTSIDTGALYRAVAYYFKSNEISEENIKSALKNIDLKAKNIDGKFNVFLNGENVTYKIRAEEISKMTSKISKRPEVRDFLLEFQRNLAKSENCVMDGRDIGTVVFPHAELKIFVTASAEVRAQRRYDELTAKGEKCNYEEILENVKERDHIDSTRETSPLRQAEDAIVLDNTHMTIPEQENWLMEEYKKRTEEE